MRILARPLLEFPSQGLRYVLVRMGITQPGRFDIRVK
jgi:hypothetical protein